jgi:uncharacterized protein (DUF1330 family)
MIAEITVTDQETYLQYIKQAYPIIKHYGGEYLVRGGEPVALFGGWQPERILVLSFPSQSDLRACFSSQEYLAIAPLREKSTLSKSVMVTGYEES